jgi:hypothetical protein
MNRQQRRKFNLTSNESKVFEELVNMAKVKKALDDWKPIVEGTKVKLNIERIKSHPDYPRLTDTYKTWIDENQNRIFTVEYDSKYKNNPQLLCLKENVEPVKWLFWEGDLIILEENK